MIYKDDVDKQITRYIEIQKEIKKLEEEQGFIKKIVEGYMQDKNITDYTDPNLNAVVIVTATRENLDKERLQFLLGQEQYQSCIKESKYSFIKIQSPDSKERQKLFMDSQR